MKRVLTYLAAAGMMIVVAGLMFSCTKEGPQGPAGAAGADGTDGKDANATCTQCHNFSDAVVAKILQYDNSMHGAGFTFERNGTSCANCHTSQGFREWIETGGVAAAIADPAPVGCRTCHMIHETYTAADWGLRATTAFTNNDGKDCDMTTTGGIVTANLCARCHQTRAANPAITDPTSTTDSVTATSYRYGPHHGPQSNMLAGIGGFDITGGKYGNSPHTKTTTCYGCHGAEAYGKQAGGHTFKMGYVYHGALEPNVAGCNVEGCHTDLETFDYDGKQTMIKEKLEHLKMALEAVGVMDTIDHPGYLVTGTYCQKTLAVFYNFKYIEEDRSMGVHNYDQAYGMLTDGIAYIESLVK